MGCARVADRLGVRGYVRNLEDGRVEVIARGAPPAVDALLAWCAEGPPGAQVSEVRSMPVDAADQAGGTVIARARGFVIR